MLEFIDGAEAIVRGALSAKCDFFAGYPITPATPILLRMLQELPKVGGVGIQGEDEIGSIGMCLGAAMTGAKAMTATSGPGISLYSENIGLAIMGEVPLVIVDVMRLGPATGGATTVAQSDVQFLQWVTSGGFPMIALCPSNVVECYTLTQRAFDLAETLRVPVYVATDKEMVSARQTVNVDALMPCPARDRRQVGTADSFVPYAIDGSNDIPAFAPIGGEHLTRFTASMHDERGILTKEPAKVNRTGRHLFDKIETRRSVLEMVHADLQPAAETLVISYGITALSAVEACQSARASGKRVSMLTVQSLWPVPEQSLRNALEDIQTVLVAELNLGQYRREIERVAGTLHPTPQVVGIHRIDGELISPEEIAERIP